MVADIVGAPDSVELLSLGPFVGINVTDQGPYCPPGYAQSASGANPTRYPQALTGELGRTNLANLNLLGLGSVATAIALYVPNSTDEQIMVCALKSTYSIFLYDVANASQQYVDYGAGSTDTAQFDQGIQYGGILYTNANRQYSSTNPYRTYLWQYPAPTNAMYTYQVSPQAGGGMLPATYYYAFTQVVTDGATPTPAFTQETSACGATVTPGFQPPGYPYSANVTGISGSVYIYSSQPWSGTFADGSQYTTNVYRQSSNLPVWYYIATLTGSTPYIDTTNDNQIDANAQLIIQRDPPPIVGGNLPAIMVHKERTWCFTIVQNADTNNLPQCQLWYSNLGRPWEFDKIDNVLLVGQSATPNNPGTYQSTYGDEPVACISLSSIGLLLKTRTSFFIFGDDPTTFLIRQAANLPGCRARQSVAVGLVRGSVVAFWLSDQGVIACDGQMFMQIDDDIRAYIRALSIADRIAAVGAFAKDCYRISFPNAGVTWCYNTRSQTWFQLPYSTSYAISTPANPSAYGATAGVNEMIAIRTGTNYIDTWATGGEGDLGSPQTVTWTGPLTDSGAPAFEKVYQNVVVVAPLQTGTATVTLTIDGVATTFPPFDLSKTTRNICEVPQESTSAGPQNRGFLAQVSITFQTIPNSPAIQIYSVRIFGNVDRALSISQ